MRRGFREWTRTIPAAERLSIIEMVHVEFKNDLGSLKRLVSLSKTREPDFAEDASNAFRYLTKFETVTPTSIGSKDIQIAIQEFALHGQPVHISSSQGVCAHDFFDQLLQSVVRTVFNADVPRPKRAGYKDQFYDFYLRTFSECWESYKPIFAGLDGMIDFESLRIQMLSEYLKAWEPLKLKSETVAETVRMAEVKNATVSYKRRHVNELRKLASALRVFSTSLDENPAIRLSKTHWKSDPLGSQIMRFKDFYRLPLQGTFQTNVDILSHGEKQADVQGGVASLLEWLDVEADEIQQHSAFSYQLSRRGFS